MDLFLLIVLAVALVLLIVVGVYVIIHFGHPGSCLLLLYLAFSILVFRAESSLDVMSNYNPIWDSIFLW